MKKLIVLSIFAGLAIAGCKKNDAVPTTGVFTVSYPTITVVGNPYYSIKVNDPLPTITATAYDSFYQVSTPVILNTSSLDNTKPGLYTVDMTSKNKYGMTSYASVFVAVTNVSDSLDISGSYLRGTNPATVTKLARGMFLTSNVGGDNLVTQASSVIPAVFAVTSDSTLDFGTQLTSAGTLTVNSATLSLIPADTTMSYSVILTGFGTQIRTFVKQ